MLNQHYPFAMGSQSQSPRAGVDSLAEQTGRLATLLNS